MSAKKRGSYAKSKQTRQRLIDVAKGLVTEKNADAITIANIVQAAEFSRPVFYRYFATVEEILKEAAGQIADEITEHIYQVTQNEADPAVRLAKGFYAYIQKAVENPILGWFLIRYSPFSIELQEVMKRLIVESVQFGIDKGSFRLTSAQIPAAETLIRGTSLMSLRMRLTEETPDDLEIQTIGLILQALGIEDERAQKIAQENA